ncbi:MAG: response regulator [Chloroflexota bacterium]
MVEESTPLSETRILIVEDDVNNRFVLTKLLQVEGVQPENIVALPGDPLTRLDSSDTIQFDLILLDLQMPHKNGFMILRELREDPRFSHVPIIAVTANVMRSDVEQAKMAGFNGFLGKPINGPRLGGRLRQILAGESVWSIS